MNPITHRSLLSAVVLCAACAMATTARAQASDDEPSPPAHQRGFRGNNPGGGPAGAAGRISDRELDTVTEFMREHAPNRWHALQTLPEGMRRGVLNFIIARYRGLEGIREDDPELYEIKLRQLAVEDQMFGLLAPLQSSEQRETVREELRKQVRGLLELNMTERQHRIERLRQSLQTEEHRLDADRTRLDELVERRSKNLISEGAPALSREAIRREPASRPTSRPATQPFRR